MGKNDITIIFPILNEQENILIAHDKIKNILNQTKYSYEIIFVDDGSTDNSINIVKELCQQKKYCKLISFTRNFGQEYAIFAGLKNSSGKCAIYLDIDMQESPDILPAMLENWENGYKVVCIRRKKRKDSFLKKFTAHLYYKFMKHMDAKNINNLANFTLLDREVINLLISSNENNVQLRTQIDWLGYKTKYLEVEREKRKFGKTKFNFKKLFKIANRSIISSTTKPLYWPFYFSLFSFVLTFICLTAFIVMIFLNNNLISLFAILTLILTCNSFLMLSLGFIGMYLAYNYEQSRNRPLYIIKETINLDE